MTRLYGWIAFLGAGAMAALGLLKIGGRIESKDNEIETLEANASARERIEDAIVDNDTAAAARERLLARARSNQ